jgi:hypothetical protein
MVGHRRATQVVGPLRVPSAPDRFGLGRRLVAAQPSQIGPAAEGPRSLPAGRLGGQIARVCGVNSELGAVGLAQKDKRAGGIQDHVALHQTVEVVSQEQRDRQERDGHQRCQVGTEQPAGAECRACIERASFPARNCTSGETAKSNIRAMMRLHCRKIMRPLGLFVTCA